MTARDDDLFDDSFFASLYDHFNPWSASDDFYLERAREAGGRILDLGCGTGLLAVRMASEGLPVVGADPAEGMLAVARSRPGGERVKWVHSDGQSLDLPERFQLIFMNGHAFQTQLSDDAAIALLRNAARHLAPSGRLVFETRNPARREWLEWTPENATVVVIPVQGSVEESHETVYDGRSGILSIAHRYRFIDQGQERIAHSRIRFIEPEHLDQLVAEAGLTPFAWYGDWDKRPLSLASPEIIVVAGRAG
jgi:SAM-dependent methyltransferase